MPLRCRGSVAEFIDMLTFLSMSNATILLLMACCSILFWRNVVREKTGISHLINNT